MAVAKALASIKAKLIFCRTGAPPFGFLCRYDVPVTAFCPIGGYKRKFMKKRHQVIIVGGGPVGVGLAVELGLRGISCALIERRTGLQNIP